MKRILTPIILIVLLAAVFLHMGCKKATDTELYILAVTVYDGVTGTPVTGNEYYNSGDQVNYSYTLLDGYSGLTVTLDDVEVESAGTITISGNHSLKAYASQGIGQFLFSVTLATGVTGTPETGFYYYNDGDQVDYSFGLEDGYTNLLPQLDGVAIPNSGTITVSGDHTLNVFAELQYDIRGTWTLVESYADQSAFTVTVTFSGEIENGTAEDSHGGIGNYTVSGNDVFFTLVFPDVTYEYLGTVSDDENMGGESRRFIAVDTYSSGTWSATKSPDASVSQKTTGRKGKGKI